MEKAKVEDAPGSHSSSLSGIRLKGSVGSERRCDLMVDRSMVVLDEGRMTGSRMRVYMSGSEADKRAMASG